MNKADRFVIDLNPDIFNEFQAIQFIEPYHPVVEDLYIEAKGKIKEVLGYEIELETEENSLRVFANKLRPNVLGRYSRKGVIEISVDEIIDWYNEEDMTRKLKKREILVSTMVHEIGHRIHDIHWDYKTVRLPRAGRTHYSGKNSKENFAEAFENLVTSNLPRYRERSITLKKAFDNKFNPQPEVIAAKNTIPERRKNLLTLDQICDEIGMTTKAARVKLRKSGKFTKGDSGWAWNPETEKEQIDIVTKFLKGEK